jgi:hypothetical protein
VNLVAATMWLPLAFALGLQSYGRKKMPLSVN